MKEDTDSESIASNSQIGIQFKLIFKLKNFILSIFRFRNYFKTNLLLEKQIYLKFKIDL